MSSPFHTLATILTEQAKLSEQLLVLLKKERQFLEVQDIAQLTDLHKKKQLTIQQLAQKDKEREQVCPINNHPNPPDAIEQVLEQCPSELHSQLSGVWQSVKKLATDCHAQNQINGKFIVMARRSLDKALKIVKGQNLHHDVYTRKGHTTSLGGQSRSFVA